MPLSGGVPLSRALASVMQCMTPEIEKKIAYTPQAV